MDSPYDGALTHPPARCTFCRIIAAGDDLVHREAHAVAFLDIRPLFPGHLLICPTEHVVTLDQLPAGQLAPVFGLVQRAVAAMSTALGAQGAFVASNTVVSQSVPHLHIHVVPRTKGDGLRGFFWPRTDYDDDVHRDQVRHALARDLAAT